MKERGNTEPKKTFEALGLYAEKRPDLSGRIPSGRPDYCVYANTGFHFWVEMKHANSNLQFSSINDDQRLWMSYGPPNIAGSLRGSDKLYDFRWAQHMFLWLSIGKSIRDRRMVFVVPWIDWLTIEKRFTDAGLAGIALHTPKKIAHRDGGLFASDALRDFALSWCGGGKWLFHYDHALMKYMRRRKLNE